MHTDIKDAGLFALASNILAIIGSIAIAYAGLLPQPLHTTILVDGYLLMVLATVSFALFIVNVVIAIRKKGSPE